MKICDFEKMINKRILTQDLQGYIHELEILEVSPNKNYVKIFNKTMGKTRWEQTNELSKDIIDVLADKSLSTSNNTNSIITQ